MGTIISVGMFGLPYVAVKTGLVPVIFYLIFLGGIVTLLHLIYGEIVLRTKEKHRLTGYAKRYLGRKGEIFAGATFFFGLYGALLAYLVIGGQFLSLLVSNFLFPLPAFWATIFMAIVGFIIVRKGLKSVGFFETLVTAILLSLILGLLAYGSNFVSSGNFVFWGDQSSIFLPYGVILFSLWGVSIIPEIREFFVKKPESFKKAIITGTTIPVVIFIIFTIVVVGISGIDTSQDSISGLVSHLGVLFSSYGALVGLLAVITSFVALSITMEDSFRFDFNLPASIGMALAFGVPVILFILGARNFISIIDWVGVILGSFEGVLLLTMHKRAKESGDREPEYEINLHRRTKYILIAILLVAVVSKFI
jgi:tyrosine-specific transport protein